MRKVLSFSGFLMLGLVISQFLPMIAGEGYGVVREMLPGWMEARRMVFMELSSPFLTYCFMYVLVL